MPVLLRAVPILEPTPAERMDRDPPPHQLTVDVDTKETFDLFHDVLEDMLPEADENTWLSVTSTTVDNAADALYLSLRQLLLTGKSEPPSSGVISIQNLTLKAMDGTKMFANMWVVRCLLHSSH